MRWDTLRIEAEEERTLPGYRDAATVRRFDAPEALDTRFYEVRAKSALNRVPEMSQVSFRWTINPYRGCSHACIYCLEGDTPVLMADGRTRAIKDLRPGDSIYGTVRKGPYRRYIHTEVRAHWTTTKPAFRITLEDGTELIASGDHRFLTSRGWKHVTGAEQGSHRRPHLTLNDKLIGVGAFARAPGETPDYRQGYLCGMVRGDGHVGSYSYERPGRSKGDVHRFRLALADIEALRRTHRYLADFGVETSEFAFSAASATRRAVTAVRTQKRAGVGAIERLIAWPRTASDEWCKGFLAGIFDAEGGCNDALRIFNTDLQIIDWTTWCLRRLGLPYVLDRPGANGCVAVRVTGGLRGRLRFFHTVDPAITRKRAFAGAAVKSDAKLRVSAIESVDSELPLYDITTGTGDFIANGVISHNCFARPTHKYLDMGAGRDFEKEIVVKVNVPEVLRRELARPSWKGEHVALGTNTDPYQWVEARYRLMPGIWEAFRDFRNPCSILTKSPLLLRDLPLMKEIAEVAPITANLSVPTLDEKAWRATEPHTPHPRKRLEAVAELNRNGIPCGILVAPLMPGINDAPEQVEPLLELAAEAGAVHIGGIALHLRGEVRDIFMEWLRSYRPDLIPRYESLYARGAYAPPAERERLSRLVGQGTSDRRRYLRDRVGLRRVQEAPARARKLEEEVEAQPSLF
jgi:DNA repair photolyase